MAAAAAAATAANGATATTMASTYLAKYTTDADVLSGEYGPLYDRYSTAIDGDAIRRAVLQTSNVIPKVFLYLVEVNGKPIIGTFHRPSTYEAHPIEASEWDGDAFIFRGDVMTGNHIPMVKLPMEAFVGQRINVYPQLQPWTASSERYHRTKII